jgi:predicted negative regulator of RcsB-dependent stress response
MINILNYLRNKHSTGDCVKRYHRHKEWVFFVSLLATIVFLICWSIWVDYKLNYLEHHVTKHEEFSIQILETQAIIIEQLKTTNPVLHEKAVAKLDELQELIQEHVSNESRFKK